MALTCVGKVAFEKQLKFMPARQAQSADPISLHRAAKFSACIAGVCFETKKKKRKEDFVPIPHLGMGKEIAHPCYYSSIQCVS